MSSDSRRFAPNVHAAHDMSRQVPRQLLKPEDIDRVALALLSLVEELANTRARQRTLEAVLARHGMHVGDEIDRLVPDAELERLHDEDRRALLERIVDSLADSPGK